MLLRPDLIDALAETLEGIALSTPNEEDATGAESSVTTAVVGGSDVRQASVLVFHPRERDDKRAADLSVLDAPLIELDLHEGAGGTSVLVQSPLGIVEMHDIAEVRLLESTREAAFISRQGEEKIDLLTVSSRGVLQVYMNVPEAFAQMELDEIGEESLRAAVALKVFSENARVFVRE